MLRNAIARANAVAYQVRGSREKVPHLLSFHKFHFLSGLLSDKMPEEITNQLFSVNSPMAWSCSILSVCLMSWLPISPSGSGARGGTFFFRYTFLFIARHVLTYIPYILLTAITLLTKLNETKLVTRNNQLE